jgi:hypothetical protein
LSIRGGGSGFGFLLLSWLGNDVLLSIQSTF